MRAKMNTTDAWPLVSKLVVSSCLVCFGITMVLAGSVVVITVLGTGLICLHSTKMLLAKLVRKACK